MNERSHSYARVVAAAPADPAPDRHAMPRISTGLSDRASTTQPRRWTLFRILSAVCIVAGIQILICIDGEIDFEVPAPIAPSYAATLAGPELGQQPAQLPSHSGLRTVDLIPAADTGAASDDDAHGASPASMSPTDQAAALRGVYHTTLEADVPAKRPVIRSRMTSAPLDQMNKRDRQAALLGLFLLVVTDPKLRFDH